MQSVQPKKAVPPTLPAGTHWTVVGPRTTGASCACPENCAELSLAKHRDSLLCRLIPRTGDKIRRDHHFQASTSPNFSPIA
jgi:hypothetical protein